MNTRRLIETLLLALLICLLPAFSLYAASDDNTENDGLGELHLASNVARGAGVDIPEGADLIGNLLIEYSYDINDWNYVTEASVEIPNLGEQQDRVYLRASYYGNEPDDYDCSVSFYTSGWNREGTTARMAQSRVISGTNLFDNENSALPISFENLSVSYSEAATRAAGSEGGITVVPGEDNSSFTIMVPVQSPINGQLVAELEAAWPSRELPSGNYEADIQIAVSTN